jgi:hypothetical protein
MSILYMFSPDVGSLDGKTTNGSISLTTARTGSRSISMGSGAYLVCNFADTDEIYWRQGIYQSDLEISPRLYFRDGGVDQASLSMNFSTGQINAYRGNTGGTLLGQSAIGVLSPSTWHCLEVHLVINDSTGIFQVRVDGNIVINISGADTQAGSNASVNNAYPNSSAGVTPWFLLDDLMCRDDDWCGQGGLVVLTPTANGTDTDWTPSAGNAWECVDEIPPSDSDYISETISGSGRHLFQMSDLPSEIKTVTAVQTVAHTKVPYASSIRVSNAIKSGATTVSGVSNGLSTSSKYIETFYDDDPNTDSEWTVSNVNAIETGVEVE